MTFRADWTLPGQAGEEKVPSPALPGAGSTGLQRSRATLSAFASAPCQRRQAPR